MFDTRGIVNTPACDVQVRLKTNGKAIKIAKETTKNQSKKYNLQGEQFSFTKTSTESKVSLKILSFNPASRYFLFLKLNARQENRSKLSLYSEY